VQEIGIITEIDSMLWIGVDGALIEFLR
jgi:hypothetical protein